MIKKFLFVLVAFLSTLCLNAQELRMPKYGFLDNWSMSAGVGANMTFADRYQEIKPQNWGPEAWVSLNKDWSPVMGTRLQLGWHKSNVFTLSGDYAETKDFLQSLKQSPNSLDASLDFTFNVLNTFSYNYDRRFNILAIAGVGYSHLFEKHNDFAEGTLLNGEVNNYKKRNYIVPKVGLQLNYKVSEPVLIFLEGDFKVYSDKLDEIVNAAQYDGQVVLTAGITYRFKNQDGTRGFHYIPSYDQEDIDALNDEINQLRAELDKKPKEVKVVETVTEVKTVKELSPITVRFEINSSEIEDKQMANLQNIADYMKDNPEVKLSITGYADAQTGSSEYNLKLSEKRAEAVKNALVKLGVEESRLEAGFEGDKVQQYTENDWNRCSIVLNN